MKFSELTAEDRKRRYRYMFELPLLIIVTTFAGMRVPIIWIGTLFTAVYIFDLYLFGLREKEGYLPVHFFKDALILISLNGINVLLVSQLITDLFFSQTNLTLDWRYLIEGITAFIGLSVLWYVVIRIENKVSKQKVLWKWKTIGPYSSDKKKFNKTS